MQEILFLPMGRAFFSQKTASSCQKHLQFSPGCVTLSLPSYPPLTGGSYSMEDSVNYAEYTVDQKAEGKFGIKKKLFILGYILFCVADKLNKARFAN
jgi:hypothetical protein